MSSDYSLVYTLVNEEGDEVCHQPAIQRGMITHKSSIVSENYSRATEMAREWNKTGIKPKIMEEYDER